MPPQAYPRAKLRRSTNFAISAGTETVVAWESADFDTGDGWDSSSPTDYVVTASGYYLVLFQWVTTSSPDGTWCAARCKRNGVEQRPTGASDSGAAISQFLVLVPGDVLRFYVVATSGVTVSGSNCVASILRVNTDP